MSIITPDTLTEIVIELRAVFPEMRLGQLICNLVESAGVSELAGLGGVEDDTLLTAALGLLSENRNRLTQSAATLIVSAMLPCRLTPQEYEITCGGETVSAIDIFYPYEAIRNWVLNCARRDQQGYPGTKQTHLFNRTKPPKLWFAEAFTSKYFHELGYKTWSESCHLEAIGKPNKWNYSNAEVFKLMGEATVERLHQAIASKDFEKWANPDVIAYHVERQEWRFLECKRFTDNWPELDVKKGQDRLKRHQVLSLKLLEVTIPNAKSLVAHVRPE